MKKLLIVKVGTSTLTLRTSRGAMRLNQAAFQRVALQLLWAKKHGYAVVVVSSSAIAGGMDVLRRDSRPQGDTVGLQVLAAVGWRHVMNAWARAFGSRHAVAELLVTRQDLERKRESSEFVGVVERLLEEGITPIINENDALSHDEITFGDNDRLAAYVATCLKGTSAGGAREVSLVLLSTIDGVYEDADDASTILDRVSVERDAVRLASTTLSDGGTGGMPSKFQAAQIATRDGVAVYVAHGQKPHSLRDVLSGRSGTQFVV